MEALQNLVMEGFGADAGSNAASDDGEDDDHDCIPNLGVSDDEEPDTKNDAEPDEESNAEESDVEEKFQTIDPLLCQHSIAIDACVNLWNAKGMKIFSCHPPNIIHICEQRHIAMPS